MSKKKNTRSTVARYEQLEELEDCLRSGWSAAMVHEYLEKRFGSSPHPRAIQRWREKKRIEVAVIPHQMIEKKLKGLNYKVNLLQLLSRLIPLCEERVGRALQNEEEVLGGMVTSMTDQAIKTYLEALREYKAVCQDLGIMPKVQTPLIDARTQTLAVTPEMLDELRELSGLLKEG